MDTLLDFRDELIDYLSKQKQFEQDEINHNKLLTEREKVDNGLLIKDAVVKSVCANNYEIQVEEDNTKLKVGDSVMVRNDKKLIRAKVIEIGIESITIESPVPLDLEDIICIEVIESVFLDPLITLLQNIDEGKPGAYFLRQLAGIEQPVSHSIGRIALDRVFCIPDSLNVSQMKVIEESLQRPSVYCIQGPPGTGKTAVLATIANAFSSHHKEVLIISNTHQAVNNALNKIISMEPEAQVVKIGEKIKSEGLNGKICLSETYNGYLKVRKTKKGRSIYADIVGMTLHAAVINLGLRNTGFQPQMVLVDEAGQMPMPYASVIGTFGSGSIVFIGDDNQMPPIFNSHLEGHPFSKSIFSYLCGLYPHLRNMLNVTYRMNKDITEYVSKNFYEINGTEQKIISSDYSKNRQFPIKIKTEVAPIISEALSSNDSIFYYKIETNESYTEYNPCEAHVAFDLVKAALENGLSYKDIAIVTPFRKQVKMIRSVFHDAGWSSEETPLINTVECLQGQDVECIIISFSVTDKTYMKQHYSFIMNRQRLNVMISRAKTKVIMIMDKSILIEGYKE